jgi:hypothetical protein
MDDFSRYSASMNWYLRTSALLTYKKIVDILSIILDTQEEEILQRKEEKGRDMSYVLQSFGKWCGLIITITFQAWKEASPCSPAWILPDTLPVS